MVSFLFFLLLGQCGAKSGSNSPSITYDSGTLDEEKAFLEAAFSLRAKGDTWMNNGYALQANYFYGQAVVAVASFRYGVISLLADRKKAYDEAAEKAAKEKNRQELDESIDELEDMLEDVEDEGGFLTAIINLGKGVQQASEKMDSLQESGAFDEIIALGEMFDDDAKLPNMWELLSAQSLTSPYPYFFEAIVLDSRGEKEQAAQAYANAFINFNFPERIWDFSDLADMPSDDLRALAQRLAAKEEELRASFLINTSFYSRDPYNFDDRYLSNLAAETLAADSTDLGTALRHIDAALRTYPFEPGYFVGCALLSARLGDVTRAANYINEGLLLDNEHKGLNTILAAWNKKGGAQ